jgi:hypothetical protein
MHLVNSWKVGNLSSEKINIARNLWMNCTMGEKLNEETQRLNGPVFEGNILDELRKKYMKEESSYMSKLRSLDFSYEEMLTNLSQAESGITQYQLAAKSAFTKYESLSCIFSDDLLRKDFSKDNCRIVMAENCLNDAENPYMRIELPESLHGKAFSIQLFIPGDEDEEEMPLEPAATGVAIGRKEAVLKTFYKPVEQIRSVDISDMLLLIWPHNLE